MNILETCNKYVKKKFIQKGLKKSIKDSVDICLNANQGLGCLYYTVLTTDNDIGIFILNLPGEEYFAIINYDLLKYSIVKNNIVIFQGDFRASQDPVQTAVHDFTVYRSLTRAIELAALGDWFEFDDYVNRMWENIISDITLSDIRCSITAHELRLRVET